MASVPAVNFCPLTTPLCIDRLGRYTADPRATTPVLRCVCTQEFRENHLEKPTDRIVEKSLNAGAEALVLEGTTHWNFQESVYWLPEWLLKRLKLVGSASCNETYSRLVESTWEFIALHDDRARTPL